MNHYCFVMISKYKIKFDIIWIYHFERFHWFRPFNITIIFILIVRYLLLFLRRLLFLDNRYELICFLWFGGFFRIVWDTNIRRSLRILWNFSLLSFRRMFIVIYRLLIFLLGFWSSNLLTLCWILFNYIYMMVIGISKAFLIIIFKWFCWRNLRFTSNVFFAAPIRLSAIAYITFHIFFCFLLNRRRYNLV